MSWLGDAADAVSNGVDAIADRATGIVDTVAGAAGDVVEDVGDAVSDALGAAAEAAASIPVAGAVLALLPQLGARLVSGVTELAAVAIRGAGNIFANLAGGALRIVGGVLTGHFGQARQGLWDILLALFGGIVAVLAGLVALVQLILFIQPLARPLNARERAILAEVYRSSVMLGRVRLIEGSAGLFSVNAFPFTVGNRIYLKSVDPIARRDILVHECCHVWQNQHEGSRYIAGALIAQWTLPDAYDWQAELDRGLTRWQDFNREAQAQFIQAVFRDGRQVPPLNRMGEFYADAPVGPNVRFVGRTDLTAFARTSVAFLRGG